MGSQMESSTKAPWRWWAQQSLCRPWTSLRVALQHAQAALWRMGLTGVHDFDGQRCFTALQRLHADGELRLRVLKSLPLADLPHAAALGLRSGFGDDFLRIGSLKGFADGALGPQHGCHAPAL